MPVTILGLQETWIMMVLTKVCSVTMLLIILVGYSQMASFSMRRRAEIIAHNMRVITGKNTSNTTDEEYQAKLNQYLMAKGDDAVSVGKWYYIHANIATLWKTIPPEYSQTIYSLTRFFELSLQGCDSRGYRNFDSELYRTCRENGTCYVLEVSIDNNHLYLYIAE